MPRRKEFHNGTRGYYVNHFTFAVQMRGPADVVWHFVRHPTPTKYWQISIYPSFIMFTVYNINLVIIGFVYIA